METVFVCYEKKYLVSTSGEPTSRLWGGTIRMSYFLLPAIFQHFVEGIGFNPKCSGPVPADGV